MTKLFLIAPLLAFSCAAAPATAQQKCAPMIVHERAVIDHNARLVFRGEMDGESEITIYGLPDGGYIVFIENAAAGVACILMSGAEYTDLSGSVAL